MKKKAIYAAFLLVFSMIPANAARLDLDSLISDSPNKVKLGNRDLTYNDLGKILIECYYPLAKFERAEQTWRSNDNSERQRTGAREIYWIDIRWKGGFFGTPYNTLIMLAVRPFKKGDYFLTRIAANNALVSPLRRCPNNQSWYPLPRKK